VLFNTLLAFTTLDDLDAVVGNCARHLKPGGRLWIDIFNPDLSLLAERETYGLDPVTFHVPALDRTVSRVTDVEDVSPGVRRVTFHYRWFESGEQQNQSVSFELAWMMPRELVLLLERHGFNLEGLWGDYDASEITTTSPRIIVQARRD
jgi:SAM-dependent methyltransferase